MLIHDIIKIKYVELGYIRKNYPYHLISDREMFEAFIDLGDDFNSTVIDPEVRFFDNYYPNPFEGEDYIYHKENPNGTTAENVSLSAEYQKLKGYIVGCINDFLTHMGTPEESLYLVPDWIYTYMLGEVVYHQSEFLDIHDTLELLECQNLDNEFTQVACAACYATSLNYVSTLTTGIRPPTVFGEPHVIKSLRMNV